MGVIVTSLTVSAKSTIQLWFVVAMESVYPLKIVSAMQDTLDMTVPTIHVTENSLMSQQFALARDLVQHQTIVLVIVDTRGANAKNTIVVA